MMTDYQVVWNTSLSKLEDHVKELMAKGWEPLGGLSIHVKEFDVVFCQAMGK
jgi:hypothetical protein